MASCLALPSELTQIDMALASWYDPVPQADVLCVNIPSVFYSDNKDISRVVIWL